MKKESKILFLVGGCVLISLVSILGTVSWMSQSTPNVASTISPNVGTANKSVLVKLKNSTAEESARTALRSLCENDYQLFLLILDKANSVEVQNRFESMKKNYPNQNYKEIVLTPHPSIKDMFETFVFDSNGEQKFWGANSTKEPKLMQISIKRKLDSTFYLSELVPKIY